MAAGAVEGVLGGAWGAAVGILAPQGRGRGILIPWGMLLLAASVGMLAAGLALLSMGLKWFIWETWLTTGALGSSVFFWCLRIARRRYEEAEMRRISASDISST